MFSTYKDTRVSTNGTYLVHEHKLLSFWVEGLTDSLPCYPLSVGSGDTFH